MANTVSKYTFPPRKDIYWTNTDGLGYYIPYCSIRIHSQTCRSMLFQKLKVRECLKLVSGTLCLSRSFPLASALHCLFVKHWSSEAKGKHLERHRVSDTSWRHSPTLIYTVYKYQYYLLVRVNFIFQWNFKQCYISY